MADQKDSILEVRNLLISFKTDHGILHAVRNISFDLYRGETLCIVGESGSGKSVTSKAIMGILAANAIVEGGNILYHGEDLLQVAEEEFHKIRGHRIGMIFQDPLSSLNPIVRIGKQITEATLINSNKLKLLYDDLISDDLIAYKNCIARGKIKEDAAKNAVDVEIIDMKKKFNSDEKPSKEDKKALKASIKAKKAAAKEQVKTIRAETKEASIPLKAKLKETEAAAKIKVNEYEANVDAEYDAEVKTIEEKYAPLLAENAGNKEELNRINSERKAELNIAKTHRIDKLKITKAEAKRRALEIMREVGIPEPEKRFKQYPFEFSGGMRQRIVIAIALTETPEILICDEPTTALDVTIQGQILELIKKIQKERNLSVIFITHDLGVVANMADRVAVMYAGKIVEYGTSEEIFFDPRHPYTWALLASIPDVDSKERLDAIPGTPPNMIYPPKGDAFAARSKYAMKIDFEKEPPFFQLSETHFAATWLLHPNAPEVEMPKIVSERIKNSLKGRKEEK